MPSRALPLLVLTVGLPSSPFASTTPDESVCNPDEGCAPSAARSMLQARSRALGEKAAHKQEREGLKEKGTARLDSVIVSRRRGEQGHEDAAPLSCWGDFGQGMVASSAGHMLGARWGVSPDACKTACMGQAGCKSVLHTALWGGYCYLMPKTIKADAAVRRSGVGYTTYYRQECAQCAPQDGSVIHGAGPCSCHGGVCAFGQRCSREKQCHSEAGDVLAEIKVVSQDLMGDYTWSQCNQRLHNILQAVASAKPTVLGCQEHPEFYSNDGRADRVLKPGYADVAATVSAATGLAHLDYGVYYDAEVLEPVGQPTLKKILDHASSSENVDRYVSGTVFGRKDGGPKFAFFSAHWDETDQLKQAQEVAALMQSAAYSGMASVLAVNFDSSKSPEPVEHIMSTLGMKDSLEGKGNTFYDNCCKVDYILHTSRDMHVTEALVDRTDATGETCAARERSDHALVGAHLSYWR